MPKCARRLPPPAPAEPPPPPPPPAPQELPVLGGGALLVVETTPPGVEVLVDGELVGETPLERADIRAGVREVTLRHPHYATVRIPDRNFEDGVALRVERVLTRGAGRLTVTATPRDAWVEVDGQRLAERTPVTLEDLPAGTVQLTVGAAEHRPLTVAVDIPRDGLARLEPALEPIPFGSLTLDLEPADATVTLADAEPRYRPGVRLPQGVHRVVVSREGYSDVTRTVDVSGDTRVRIALELAIRAGESRVFDGIELAIRAGESRVFDGMEFVWIPAGEFRMGSTSREAFDDERPMRQVRIRQGFWLGKHEVTQAEWQREMGSNPSHFDECGPTCPVERVSWNDAQEFIGGLNARGGGNRYRLPTEAEWEYAARAGTTTGYWWGNAIGDNRANCDGCGSQWDNESTAPVGSFAANAWGLHDVHGNVWEWVEDCWHGNYEGAPGDGSAWTSGGRLWSACVAWRFLGQRPGRTSVRRSASGSMTAGPGPMSVSVWRGRPIRSCLFRSLPLGGSGGHSPPGDPVRRGDTCDGCGAADGSGGGGGARPQRSAVSGASVVFLLAEGGTAMLNAGLSQVTLTTNALGRRQWR